MPSPARRILITPYWCVSPRTGGGQRTGVFFSALQRLGPTEVVVIGKDPGRELLDAAFPGHAGLTLIPDMPAQFLDHRPTRRELWADRLERYVRLRRDYSAHPAIRDRLRELVGADRAILVHRYVPTFCWAGHGPQEARRHLLCVDVDDRDDHRLETTVSGLVPNRAAMALYRATVLPRMRRFLRRELGLAARVWFAAEEDLAGFEALPAEVIPNVPFTAPEGAIAPPSARRDLLFVGTFGFAPNRDGMRWFLRHCWPGLRARFPEARVRVVGSGDWSGNWDRLAAEFPGLEGVDLVGPVDDLGAEYARARAVIAPIFVGAGSKIKVIEACAWGRPVVTTSHSSRGFGARIEALLPESDTPQGFSAACARFLDQPDEADRLGAALQALQQAEYSRPAVEARIGAGLTAAAAARAGA